MSRRTPASSATAALRSRAQEASGGPDINIRIAERVRELRADLGLSLDTLSAKCGGSRSMLSLVERGESSPTASVLDKIATGLDVSLATLFDDPTAAASPVSHREDREPRRDPESGYRRNVSPVNFPSSIQIVEVELPAGARVAHESGARETRIHQQIWVQDGRIEVTVGPVTYRLSAGDCLAMTLDAPIVIRNRTRRTARYYAVLARSGSPRAAQ